MKTRIILVMMLLGFFHAPILHSKEGAEKGGVGREGGGREGAGRERVGNGSGLLLAIDVLPTGEGGLAINERLLLAFESGAQPDPSQIEGDWIGLFVSRKTSGQTSLVPYVFRFQKSTLGSVLGDLTFLGKATSPTINLDFEYSVQLDPKLQASLHQDTMNIDESRLTLVSGGLIRQEWNHIVVPTGPTTSQWNPLANNHDTIIRTFQDSLIGIMKPKEGSQCERFSMRNARDFYGPEIEGQDVQGTCGIWYLFRKLK